MYYLMDSSFLSKQEEANLEFNAALIGVTDISEIIGIISESYNQVVDNYCCDFESASKQAGKYLKEEINKRKKFFSENFNAFFDEYDEKDLMLLKRAFYHYRSKLFQLDIIKDKKNPKNFEIPYINALQKIKSIYSIFDKNEEEQKILTKAFDIIQEDIEQLARTKRETQREKNKLIEHYLKQLKNKKQSVPMIINEFKRLNEIL